MREYPIKRGHFKNIEGEKFTALINEHFKDHKKKENGTIEAAFGALSNISLTLEGKTKLLVETTAKENATDEEMLMTHRVYNAFLHKATGFTAKERAKKVKGSVKDK